MLQRQQHARSLQLYDVLATHSLRKPDLHHLPLPQVLQQAQLPGHLLGLPEHAQHVRRPRLLRNELELKYSNSVFHPDYTADRHLHPAKDAQPDAAREARSGQGYQHSEGQRIAEQAATARSRKLGRGHSYEVGRRSSV